MNSNGEVQNNAQFNLAVLQQQPPYKSLLRAEQITAANFPFLNEGELANYPNGVKNLWAAIISKPAEDPTHQTALQKLSQLTGNVLKKYHAHKLARQNQNAAQQQEGARPSSQGQSQQAQQAHPPQVQAPQQHAPQPLPPQGFLQSLPPAPGAAQFPVNTQSQLQAQQQNGTQPRVAPLQSQVAGAQAQLHQQQVQEQLANIKQKVESVQWEIPPKLAAADAENWRAEATRRYQDHLMEQMKAREQLVKLTQMAQQARATGQELSDSWAEAKALQERKFTDARKFIEDLLRSHQKGHAVANSQSTGNTNGVQNPQIASQPMQRQGSAGMSQTKVLPPGAPSSIQSSGNPALNAVRQQQQARPTSPALPPQPQQVQAPAPQVSQPQPISHSQPPPLPAQRPQPNPTQFPQHPVQSPQSALPTGQQGSPAPLTQQAAIAAAQRSYSNLPQGLPMSNLSANSSRADVDKNNNKQWPMNKSWVPQPPQPVQMGSARPTLSGANNGPMGMMGAPVIQKQPPFLLHGAGDRVLDKKKLDELVRQVTGGSGDGLHPDVEESVLQLADEFIDNVITSACKLAKLRGSPSLEIRDIQLVLERQYNIRVPGYATDEIRTVRKIQPVAGYLQKMNAVQAAKVMGGKTDI